ncbi:excinuclease ABC subunit UvrA [bacterium]|nr:excinuclease ABC subunit UvrA [bacterium]
MAANQLIIKGAREHNLRNITVEIPRDRLVVITGLSGSGKSSLAFDTIYAEGQRRYVESLSAYARQFLEQFSKPDVDAIEGLSPAISIEQKTTSKNPRSTVGTVTEIYDYLRLLYARVGKPFCHGCGREIAAQTPQQIVDIVLHNPEDTALTILAPVVRGRKGEYRKELSQFAKEGFVRAMIDGKMYDLSEAPELDKKRKHDIDIVIDRIKIREGVARRLTDSIETALAHGHGLVKVIAGEGEPQFFSEHFACIACGISYPELEPRLFSFNNPHGACPTCGGLGSRMFIDPELVVPNPDLSLREGAVAPWVSRIHSMHFHQLLDSLGREFAFDLNTPWKRLPKRARDVLLHGTGDAEVKFTYEDEARRYSFRRAFEGVMGNLDRRFHETSSEAIRDEIRRFMSVMPCADCGGTRLRLEARNVRVAGRAIAEISAMSIKEAVAFFRGLALAEKDAQIAERVLREINERLGFLNAVGLDYLSLDRTSATLSGGESQRIRLATQIGSSLVGVLYILDEPSIGLHQRDNERLLAMLKRLRDLGNTVLVVEHDADTIMAADFVIDMGPGAGRHGGEVVFAGTTDDLVASKKSLTGRYIAGELSIPVPAARRKPGKRVLKLHGCRGNNLRQIDVAFPLGLLTCVTGVSGSGKSTLVLDTLNRALAQRIYRAKDRPAPFREATGLANVDKVINIDQSPIGRTPRSNPATYTGLFTPIRDLFAGLPESKVRGYAPGRFSFNVKGGRCEACEGDGVIKIEMHFLPDVYVTCDECKGRRYNRDTLEVKYKHKSIADVLDMTVNDAHDFFASVPSIRGKLETLRDVGLGYIHLGQAATTLSGGEAQRIKLSRELSKRGTGRTVYILDEPTTGLHFEDIKSLLSVLDRLVEAGNTVIVIEHNLDVIKTADHVIDLGPEGGDGGGRVVAIGTPEQIARTAKSHTGRFLAPILKNKKVGEREAARHIPEPRPVANGKPERGKMLSFDLDDEDARDDELNADDEMNDAFAVPDDAEPAPRRRGRPRKQV